MIIPGLSVRVIEEHAEQGSIERGKEYFESGSIRSLKRRSDDEVEVFVQGTNVAPYRVTIRHDETGITAAECTCPYVSGSWCRHIVSALYGVLDSEGVASQPASEMLEELSRSELLRLIEAIVEEHPDASSLVERAYRRRHST